MRTKNFFKGLAVAAVAVMGVFATSCSEEEFKVTGQVTGNGTEVTLSPAVATLVINVVDLGDKGVAAKTLYTATEDVTASIGSTKTVDCPEFEGYAEYTVAKSQSISVPAIDKGQAVVIPVTFYVTKLTSAYAAVLDSEEQDYNYWEYSEDEQEDKTASFANESDYEITEYYTVHVPTGIESYDIVDTAVEARAAVTTDEDIIKAVLDSMVGEDEYAYDYDEPIVIAPWTVATVTETYQYLHTKSTYSYGDTTLTVIFNKVYNVTLSKSVEEIDNGHDHDHGHGHGSDSNAGGGSGE